MIRKTLTALLRWHAVPFVGGMAIGILSLYFLATYQKPSPTSLDNTVWSPAQALFHPAMELCLAVAAVVVIRAILVAARE